MGSWVGMALPIESWIDSEGRLLHGKHKGELAESVAVSDHSYIRWLVDNIENMNEEDREILSSLLYYRRS